MKSFDLSDLESAIADRANASPAESWTAKLVSGGMETVAKKFGEEALETVIAALAGNSRQLVHESADMLYHWLVLLKVADVPFDAVLKELESRTARSGLQEKAERSRE